MTVTLNEIYTGIAYQQDALQMQITQTLDQRLGARYALTGQVQVRILGSRMESQQTFLSVQATGV